jgi:hypothetical protein
MGFFSAIGGAIGTVFGPVGQAIGSGLGGVLDGKKTQKNLQKQVAENNRVATIAAQNTNAQMENNSRPVETVTTQKADFDSVIADARKAGINPLTALRIAGVNTTTSTTTTQVGSTRYVAPLLSSMPTRNFTNVMADAFNGYQSFERGRTQKMQLGLETELLKSQVALNYQSLQQPNFPKFSADGTKIEPAFIDTRYPDGTLVRIPNPELYEMGPFELLVGALLQGGSATADAMGGDSVSPAQIGQGIKKIGQGVVTSTSSFAERFMHGFTTGQWVFPKTTPIKNNFKSQPNYNEPIVEYPLSQSRSDGISTPLIRFAEQALN